MKAFFIAGGSKAVLVIYRAGEGDGTVQTNNAISFQVHSESKFALRFPIIATVSCLKLIWQSVIVS